MMLDDRDTDASRDEKVEEPEEPDCSSRQRQRTKNYNVAHHKDWAALLDYIGQGDQATLRGVPSVQTKAP